MCIVRTYIILIINCTILVLNSFHFMFIGFCGLKFVGKKTFSRFLRDIYNFTIVQVSSEPSPPGNERILNFPNMDELLEWVTERWQEDFVLADVVNFENYEKISKRPFFILIEIKSRVCDRFRRKESSESLNEMLKEDDFECFKGDGLMKLGPFSSFTFLNCAGLKEFKSSIRHLGLNDDRAKKTLTRPDWDGYFMRIADFAAKRTNCMKKAVGAVLVQDKRIVSTGYNGTARGLNNCFDGGCDRCNSNTKCGLGLDSCLCLHAEENALLEAGRIRAANATLYCTTAPCLSCARKICQMAVSRVVFHKNYTVKHFAEKLFKEAGIVLEKYEGNLGGSVVINCSDEIEVVEALNDEFNLSLSNLSIQ